MDVGLPAEEKQISSETIPIKQLFKNVDICSSKCLKTLLIIIPLMCSKSISWLVHVNYSV